MVQRLILFFGTAVFMAAALYIVAHDVQGVCRSTIEIASLLGAAAMGAAWLAETVRNVVKSWL